MALSTIIILMLINGFTVTEMMGAEIGGMKHGLDHLPGITGALGLWGERTKFWLAVPTSVFGMVLPIAHITFFPMTNNKSLMGTSLPQGNKRIVLNIAMGVALWPQPSAPVGRSGVCNGRGDRGRHLLRAGDHRSFHPVQTGLRLPG